MDPSQTSILDYGEDPPQGTLEELAFSPKVRGFIERVLNDYVPPKRHLLLIPESRQQPFTRSKLYAKVQEFFQETSLNPKYHIVFVSHVFGACPEELAEEQVPNFKLRGKWSLDEEAISRTSRLIAGYLERTKRGYRQRVVYARGSYLQSVRLASTFSRVRVVEVLREEDLCRLKHRGIRWMKVGLRMEEAFSIFRQRVVELMGVQTRLSGV